MAPRESEGDWGESETESGAWAGLGGRLFQVSQEERGGSRRPQCGQGAAGGARDEHWAGKPRADCLPGRAGVSCGMVSKNPEPGGRQWRSGPPPTQAPGSCGGGLSEGCLPGAGRARGGSTQAPPALMPRIGVTRELGLPESAPGGAGVLQGESHHETEERGAGPWGLRWQDGPWWDVSLGAKKLRRFQGGSPGATRGKNLPVSAGDVRDLGRRAPWRRP